eukprot:GHVU01230421.1.p1 GENE.GHVU01230421.1~~GHVU01230421.1.p1  ORF type:complete len:383 (-),score=42.05 GHVU01230421.1:799-1947(-)
MTNLYGRACIHEQVEAMSSSWCDAMSQIVSFSEILDVDKSTGIYEASDVGATWRARILHLFSLLHAMCIRYLLNDTAHDRATRDSHALELLGGVSRSELEQLCGSDDQAYTVGHKIEQEVTRTHHMGLIPVPPPILSRFYQVLGQGMLAYNQAAKVEATPFPFPYAQLIWAIDVVVILLTPFVMACWNKHVAMAVAHTAAIVAAYHALFITSRLMASPFGYRANDLPLLDMHGDFISRAKLMIDRAVAEKLDSSIRGQEEDVTTALEDAHLVSRIFGDRSTELPTDRMDSGASLASAIGSSDQLLSKEQVRAPQLLVSGGGGYADDSESGTGEGASPRARTKKARFGDSPPSVAKPPLQLKRRAGSTPSAHSHTPRSCCVKK